MIKIFFILLLFPILSNAADTNFKSLTGKNVFIVYKNGDEASKRTAQYYAEKREIPLSQMMGVTLEDGPRINIDNFKQMRKKIKAQLSPDINVVVFTWHTPYGVGCMSLTSAFTLGYDEKYCMHTKEKGPGCHPTADSPYFNKSNSELWQNQAPVLSIMLSGKTFEEAKKLIDRGVAADFTKPEGSAFLVNSRSTANSTRWPIFKRFAEAHPKLKDISIYYVDETRSSKGTKIKYKKNVMFYFTGSTGLVPNLNSNKYLPGAIADHLTSFGGMGIDDKVTRQMKAYRWLEAGLTGSYGTVIEPCNYPQKFPNPAVLIPHYVNGDTLIEAYWKSVQQPGEGIFIGEPLASPWKRWQLMDFFTNKDD